MFEILDLEIGFRLSWKLVFGVWDFPQSEAKRSRISFRREVYSFPAAVFPY